MQPERHAPVDRRALLFMVLICAIWGFQQVAVKATSSDMAPTIQLALRFGLTLPLVLGLAAFRGEASAILGGVWKPGLVVGFLFGLEYLLVAKGVSLTSASHIGTFIYVGPIFTALGLHLTLRQERLRQVQWFGVGLAFVGVAVALTSQSNSELVAIEQSWLGDLLGIASGLAWAATTVAIRLTSLDRAVRS